MNKNDNVAVCLILASMTYVLRPNVGQAEKESGNIANSSGARRNKDSSKRKRKGGNVKELPPKVDHLLLEKNLAQTLLAILTGTGEVRHLRY